jgi:hypothetical protein
MPEANEPSGDRGVEARPPAAEPARAKSLVERLSPGVGLVVAILTGLSILAMGGAAFNSLSNGITRLDERTNNLDKGLQEVKGDLKELERRFSKFTGAAEAYADAGADAASDAEAPVAESPWPSGHVPRREKFCSDKCKVDDACVRDCRKAYNLCGIEHPSDPLSDEFRQCVKSIK